MGIKITNPLLRWVAVLLIAIVAPFLLIIGFSIMLILGCLMVLLEYLSVLDKKLKSGINLGNDNGNATGTKHYYRD